MFEKFDWDDRLLTGIKDIDNDHVKLFSFINTLLREAEGNQSHAVISVTISELIDYASTHFELEEGYMEQWGYPDIEQHRAQHISLTEEVIKIAENFEKDPESVDVEWFAEFLIDWLIHHINERDFAYVEYLKSHPPEDSPEE
ncbi:MAG: hemerythrin family protein [Rhodospirillaceae bacterium]|jgi:hemerythrin-like metal-binding protein|nr:hemerythrin family protein [Rhodospirillales bacterium]MBT3907661.1 hemerythrin family protein [Rhodospirillaceae bacterium]MBT4700559.1 hemerythrin family protein [Rhodospirillaceae bacterium]MBT5033682.1 hemerythrin family protein [Rhodospirillaceae bacterium]MBT6221398.1 hemerythrin family protein [Rhodospirillaceae bacterium]